MRFYSFFVLFFLLIISTTVIPPAFTSHDSGGSGGCSGDCNSPTLGQDNTGRTYVHDGFAINGNSYDVEYFKQYIPTETVKINENL